MTTLIGMRERLLARRGRGRPVTGAAPAGPYVRLGKRLLDLVLVLAAAPVALPLLAMLAAVVFLHGRAPFERHVLVGRNGRAFSVWRLRCDARDAHLELRQTAFGCLMRRTGLDLLPMWWNVLFGDMSLVGPRPLTEAQRGLYPGLAYRRMRPGVTGYWQIAGMHRTTFAERAKLDAEYEAALTLRTDLVLIGRLLAAAVRGARRAPVDA
jgi:lipopolysaccharide/colanic/teichoic acid biosynthesis glycosyltransferase